MRYTALVVFIAWFCLQLTESVSAQSSSLYSNDPAQVVTKTELADVIGTSQGKQSMIPTAGPGPGLCKQTIVPSELVTSGGMVGTAGTCSRILQCGTSAAYVVTQFNVGGGC